MSVICGKVVLVTDAPDTATNPVVLIEVLSDATRDYDRGEKFELYKTIPTLREYVLIDQQRIVVDHFTRRRDSWTESSAAALSSKVSLRSLKVDLSVREVYRGVA